MTEPRATVGRDLPTEAEEQRTYELVATLLEPRVHEVAGELAEAYLEELPAFASFPVQMVQEQTVETLSSVVRWLRSGRPPGEAEATEIAQRARLWAAAEVPLEIIGQSFHVGARRFVGILREHADELGLDAGLMFAAQDRAWEWGIFGARAVAEVQREQEVAAARRDATRRADFLRDLALGRVGADRLATEAAIFDLDLEQPYVAVCARSPDGAGAAALEADVRRSGATSTHRVMQATVDGRLLALAPRRPSVTGEGPVAVGPAVALPEVHAAFVEAGEVLQTARAFGLTGVVELATVGPLVLATLAGGPAARLAELHLGPLGEEVGDLETTVRTLLDLDQGIDETAARLHLHRNTVRYRVTRFRELTGLDIRRTDDLVTTWWLLKWRESRRS